MKKYKKILAAQEAVKKIGACRNIYPKKVQKNIEFQLSFLASYYLPKKRDISIWKKRRSLLP